VIKVYHNDQFTDYFLKKEITGILCLAAEVDCASLDSAYELTNNIDHAWTENENVRPTFKSRRSTSVGDVMQAKGKYHVVESCGFRELTQEETSALRYDA
jgi:hypothetical protein